MDVSQAEPLDAVSVRFGEIPRYRVRAWTRPASPENAWMVDEWDVSDAPGVDAVIAWAEAQVADSVEVFLQWDDHAENRDGETVVRRRFTRLYGQPADDDGSMETVVLTTNE